MEMFKTKKGDIGGFLAGVCFLCNISQIPQLMGNSLLRILYLSLWIILFFILCLRSEKFQILPLVPLIIFDIFCALFQFASLIGNQTQSYFTSNLFQPMHLCAFILIIGMMCGKSLTHKDFQNVAFAFIVSALIVAAAIYLNVFRGTNWASEGAYLYSSKNSAGQIFLTAIVLLLFMFNEKNKILTLLISAVFILLIFMMKSRATILSAVILVVYDIFFVIKNPKKKAFLIVLLIVAVAFIFLNPTLYNLIIEEIMLRNKELTDITGVTSNRDLHIRRFLKMFPEYWLIGTGGSYIESFPLAGLLSYGILGFLPILIFSIYPLCTAIKYRKRKDLKLLIFMIIALNLMMWFNGIFEELSPFGPGVKCYFLWLSTGILLSKAKNDSYEVKKNENTM